MHELNNPAVNWISRTPTNEGYLLAMEVLQYFDGVRVSLGTSIVAAVGQTLIGAMVAYGFARIRFPGRDFLFALLLFTIVVPPQTTMVPQFMLYTDLKWTNTYLPLMVPPFLSYGVRGGILLIVFRQFFRGLPYELEDAAHVDGAGPFRIFWQIMLPLAKPAILVVMLFSLVWTWNDNFTPWLVLRDNTLYTLTQRMEIFNSLLNNFSGSTYTRLEGEHLHGCSYVDRVACAVDLPVRPAVFHAEHRQNGPGGVAAMRPIKNLRSAALLLVLALLLCQAPGAARASEDGSAALPAAQQQEGIGVQYFLETT